MKVSEQPSAAPALRGHAATDGTQALALVLSEPDESALARLAEPGALPFAADRRVIDFPVGNCLASGIRRVALLTRGKPPSLASYLLQRSAGLAAERGEFIDVWAARRRQERAALTPAMDLLMQNVELIAELELDYVLVLKGTEIYRTDYRPLLEAHVRSGCGATIGCLELASAPGCGVATVDARGRVLRLHACRADGGPQCGAALASIGAYVFDRDLLLDCLAVDAADEGSTHDLVNDLLPLLIRASGVHAHVLRGPAADPTAYWRNVASIDGYWRAHMELLSGEREIDLTGAPLPSCVRAAPRVVGAGTAARSIIAGGCTIEGRVEDSVLSHDCRVAADALVAASVLLPGARIGRGARIRRAIVGAGCELPAGTVIGEDWRTDAHRFTVSPGGVAVIGGCRHALAAREALRRV